MITHGDTVGGMFVSAARDYPQRTFLKWSARRRGESPRAIWTYADAALQIDALVAQLDALGIVAGDHVLVHSAEMVPSILFDLACACAGVVFTPLETSSLPAVIEMATRIHAKAILTTPERKGPYDALPIIAFDRRAQIVGDANAAIARLAERVGRVDGEKTYMLQPTSGTTGGSKLVIRHHAVFTRIGDIIGCGIKREDDPPARFLMVAALTHGMGQYLLAMAMQFGAELCVTSQIDVNASIEEVRWLDPTYIGLTPRVLRSFVQQLGGVRDGDKIFGPSARFLMSGGAAPDNDLLAAVERSGVHVIEAYGASEMSVVATTRPGTWRPGVVGHVVGDVTLRTSDEGELQAMTPVLMRGYFESPEHTRAAFTEDGYYRTGDRVAIEPDGQLRYVGRVVDSFNLFDGSHVAPGPIEDALTRLPWVDQVLLIGDQRPYIAGFVVPHPSLRDAAVLPSLRSIAQTDVGRICSGLETNARVRRLVVLNEPLPADLYQIVGHGKVRRLRAKLAAARPDVVEALYAASAGEGVELVDIPGSAAERRASARHKLAWLVRVHCEAGPILAYTRDVGRGGAFLECAQRLEPGTALTVEVIESDGKGFQLGAEILRSDATGAAVRWTGPDDGHSQLALRLKQ